MNKTTFEWWLNEIQHGKIDKCRDFLWLVRDAITMGAITPELFDAVYEAMREATFRPKRAEGQP